MNLNRILITGAHGLLGQKSAIAFGRETGGEILCTDLAPTSFFTTSRFDYSQLDLTRLSDVKSMVASFRPDVIVNTAAMTDVDQCEMDRELAWRVNVDAVKHLIIAARRLEQCRIIHVSTDYVFDGQHAPYNEESRPAPVNYYGKTKLAAENALCMSGVEACTLRSQVLYGTGLNVRQNFVGWVIAMLGRKKKFTVVDDQIGNPTFVDDLAFAIVKCADRHASGLYHVAGSEAIDRLSFAKKIAAVFGKDESLIEATKTSELNQLAPRPVDSTFITLKFESEFGFKLADCDQGLRRLHGQLLQGAEFLERVATSAAEPPRDTSTP